MTKLKAFLAILLMTMGLASASTPAQADTTAAYVHHYASVVTTAAHQAHDQTAAGLKATGPCPQFGFCLSPSFGANYVVAFAANTPRNTCESWSSPAGTNFATENTGVQWWLFRTTTCGGSHIVVHAYTNLTLPAGWSGAIVAAMRTSTVGKNSITGVSLLSKKDYALIG